MRAAAIKNGKPVISEKVKAKVKAGRARWGNKTLEQRLEDNSMPEPNSGCILWLASVNNRGYGRTWDGEKVVLAHVLSYQKSIGAIPIGTELDHICHVRSCINPLHLQPVSHQENCRRGLHVNRAMCLHGHKYAENAAFRSNGERYCGQCNREQNRRRYLKRLAQK